MRLLGSTYLLIEWRNRTSEGLGRKVTASSSHLRHLIVCTWSADIGVLNCLNRLAKPITINLLRTLGTKISLDRSNEGREDECDNRNSDDVVECHVGEDEVATIDESEDRVDDNGCRKHTVQDREPVRHGEFSRRIYAATLFGSIKEGQRSI